MKNKSLVDWANLLKNKRILFSFSVPKTPTQVKDELGVAKFSLKPFLKRGFLKCLNPNGNKGRLYVLSNRARKLVGAPLATNNRIDYELVGWILASPRQRLIVLKTLSLNSVKLTSEEIRIKSANLNPCLSRISTKTILKELIGKGLVETEKGIDRRRYYWVTEKGKSLASEFQELFSKPIFNH